MAKSAASAERIREEIRRRIQSEAARTGRCGSCEPPVPVPLAERRGDGVNWTIEHFPMLEPGCTVFMMRILSEMMSDYDLD